MKILSNDLNFKYSYLWAPNTGHINVAPDCKNAYLLREEIFKGVKSILNSGICKTKNIISCGIKKGFLSAEC